MRSEHIKCFPRCTISTSASSTTTQSCAANYVQFQEESHSSGDGWKYLVKQSISKNYVAAFVSTFSDM